MSLAKRIEDKMRKHRLTIGQAAEIIGVSRSTLHQILCEETREPSPSTMDGIMSFLDKPAHDDGRLLSPADRQAIASAMRRQDVRNKSQLARDAGVHRQQVYDLFAGRSRLSFETADAILSAVGLDIHGVLAGVA